jgi:hypothetical protein
MNISHIFVSITYSLETSLISFQEKLTAKSYIQYQGMYGAYTTKNIYPWNQYSPK